MQGSREVVAFAIERLSARTGTLRVGIGGDGELVFHLIPSAPRETHDLTVYQHYVSTPVQIGAATSPAAILSPLAAFCEREQYVKAGMPVPAGAR